MTIKEILSKDEVRSVVDDYRGMCFWSMAEDFTPQDARQLRLVVENLERYGDMAAYRRGVLFPKRPRSFSKVRLAGQLGVAQEPRRHR